MARKKLGEVLKARGHISELDLEKLFREQKGKMVRLGELILERGLVDKASLVKALEEVSRVPYMDCASVQSDPAVLQTISKPMAVRLDVLPVHLDQSRLVVIMAEPQNVAAIDELRFTTGKEVSPRFGFRAEIRAGILRNYDHIDVAGLYPQTTDGGALDDGTEMAFISTSSRQANREAIQEVQAELNQKRTPAVRLVSEIIHKALEKQASDIHLEPQADATFVRIRVDGVLRELESVPRNIQNSLISRIKILADMDIAERRNPQDGRFMVAFGQRKVDMRISTLPTQYGEKVVMRLLESNAPILSLADLGLPPYVAEHLNHLISLPQGMLLVTGPTGSGKSTTLYSILNLLRKPAVNIVTVEDPVEYVLRGVNQVHVNARTGLTFASCLRSILRQDPNVIMVGEIRDLETAEIAMKAAQTGHLVLSSLHTNDSISAVARLLDLGIPEYLIGTSVTGVVAQRLVRKLCVCAESTPVLPDMAKRLASVGWLHLPDHVLAPKGCPVCDYLGYKGRVGVYELLPMDDAIRTILHGGYKPELVQAAARSAGMRRMQQDALEKLQLGVTTVDEVERVVPIEVLANTGCEGCGWELGPTYRFCPHCGVRRADSDSGPTAGVASHVKDGVLS